MLRQRRLYKKKAFGSVHLLIFWSSYDSGPTEALPLHCTSILLLTNGTIKFFLLLFQK